MFERGSTNRSRSVRGEPDQQDTSTSVLLNTAFFSIIFELIKGETQYVRDLENIDVVSVTR